MAPCLTMPTIPHDIKNDFPLSNDSIFNCTEHVFRKLFFYEKSVIQDKAYRKPKFQVPLINNFRIDKSAFP